MHVPLGGPGAIIYPLKLNFFKYHTQNNDHNANFLPIKIVNLQGSDFFSMIVKKTPQNSG